MESLVEKLCHRFSGVSDVKQWEYISYCLSQLTFTEKSMRKLMDSFKIYEHALSKESVMDHFRNLISKGKKFAKPELKSCIEEFEEKIHKLHLEKMDQERTTKNALAHTHRIDNLGRNAVRTEGEESEDSEVVEDGDVSNGSLEPLSCPKSKTIESKSNSQPSSEVTESDLDEDEVLSLQSRPKVSTRSKIQKSCTKNQSVVSTKTRNTKSKRSK